MKILILIEISSLGGHVLSAITTGKELKKRGHEVHFAGGPGPMENAIRETFNFTHLPFFYNHGSRQTYFTWKSLKTLRELTKLSDRLAPDHIHAFDARSYILASMLGIQNKLPVTGTLCGGITPYYNIPLSGELIVFSPEQKDKLMNVYSWKQDNIAVISSRLDMEQFSVSRNEADEFCRNHDIDSNRKNIFMITNFLGPKIAAIRHVLDAVHPVLKKYSDAGMVFIGSRGEFFHEAKDIGERINLFLGRDAVHFTGAVMQAHRFLPSAFAVLGVGRSAFEGMANMKPTLIVGEHGYAGTVGKDNITEISYFNFSGRNNKISHPPSVLSQELERLFTDAAYYDQSKAFGRDYLKAHIDIKSGISRIENVYESNRSFTKRTSFLKRVFNLLKVLSVIILDNYYNQGKQIIQKFIGLIRHANDRSSPST